MNPSDTSCESQAKSGRTPPGGGPAPDPVHGHTPLPWEVNEYGRHEVIAGPATGRRLVADCRTALERRAEDLANAEFVARACNAHDDLLAAAKAVLAYVGYHDRPRTTIPEWDALIAAIAKAEGRAS